MYSRCDHNLVTYFTVAWFMSYLPSLLNVIYTELLGNLVILAALGYHNVSKQYSAVCFHRGTFDRPSPTILIFAIDNTNSFTLFICPVSLLRRIQHRTL